MRRRLSLTAALVLLLSLLCACAAQHAQEMDENGYELYFLSDPNSAGGGDAIRTQEKRLTLDGAMETEDCVRALMEALLAGPDEPSLSSPIPEGTALKSLKVSGRRAQIDLSAQYARLTGIDLSLADYCITLTLTQLPNVNAVSIMADGRELPYRETQVLLSADTLLSSRESGLRPITVSLYFLDSKTGELRAEQQTLALYEGQTRVNALLEALAQGPEDDSLVSLLPEDFAVISSRIENGVCYLNLPANVSLPENEAERDLMLSALEQSILSLGGVVLGGKLLTGYTGAASEIGHMVIAENGEECTCGSRGCFEAYSSATALIRDTKRTMAAHPESLLHAIAAEQGGVDGRTAFLAKERGDEAGAQVVEDYIEHLACGLTNLVNIFFPEVLALSGGVANQGDALLLPLRERVRERSFGSRYAVSHTRIELCTLGYRAGVIGAAMLARE